MPGSFFKVQHCVAQAGGRAYAFVRLDLDSVYAAIPKVQRSSRSGNVMMAAPLWVTSACLALAGRVRFVLA